MLLILIPITWLTVLTVVVAVCHMAARADGNGPVADSYIRSVSEALTMSSAPPVLVLHARHASDSRRPLGVARAHRIPSSTGRRRRVAAHPSR